MRIWTCTTAPMSDLAPPTYHLFQCRCNQDETYMVYPLFQCYWSFQFNVFKVLRDLSSLYPQCKVLVYDSSDHQPHCNPDCVSRRKRNISSYKWKTNSSLNPFIWKGVEVEGTQKKLRINLLPLFLFMVLGLNVVIVATIIARHFVSQKVDCKYQKLPEY